MLEVLLYAVFTFQCVVLVLSIRADRDDKRDKLFALKRMRIEVLRLMRSRIVKEEVKKVEEEAKKLEEVAEARKRGIAFLDTNPGQSDLMKFIERKEEIDR